MYHYVTKVMEGTTTYCQVHNIINDEASDRKGFYMKRVTWHYFSFCINMDLLICIFFDVILMVWCILHLAYVYIETKKLVYATWCNGN
jgi:hypothetical protein